MSEFKLKTSYGDTKAKYIFIRESPLLDVIDNLTFTQAIFLLLQNRLPDKRETRLLDAIFIAVMEQDIAKPHIISHRAFKFTSMHPKIASKFIASDRSIKNIEWSARFFQKNIRLSSKNIVSKHKSKLLSEHKIYAERQEGCEKILKIARKERLFGKHIKMALNIEKEIRKRVKKNFYLSLNGCVAALLLDMGVDWRFAGNFFIIPRMAGLIAHLHEEWASEMSK